MYQLIESQSGEYFAVDKDGVMNPIKLKGVCVNNAFRELIKLGFPVDKTCWIDGNNKTQKVFFLGENR